MESWQDSAPGCRHSESGSLQNCPRSPFSYAKREVLNASCIPDRQVNFIWKCFHIFVSVQGSPSLSGGFRLLLSPLFPQGLGCSSLEVHLVVTFVLDLLLQVTVKPLVKKFFSSLTVFKVPPSPITPAPPSFKDSDWI